MGTVVFDFDSTLVACESLEEILKLKKLSDDDLKEIHLLSNLAMEGKIPFAEVFAAKMNAATLTKQDIVDFGNHALSLIVPGMQQLVDELMQQSIDVWVISGALTETLWPIGARLGIPHEHLLGIDVLWSKEGIYVGINPDKAHRLNKWQTAKEVSQQWTSPKICVGDAMTDYELFQHGLVDHFIAFTPIVRRQAVVDTGVPEADSVDALKAYLKGFFHG